MLGFFRICLLGTSAVDSTESRPTGSRGAGEQGSREGSRDPQGAGELGAPSAPPLAPALLLC